MKDSHKHISFISAEEKRALLAQLLEKKDFFPLSFAQQRLWFLNQLEPSSSLYNIAHAVRLKGSLNVIALEQTLNEIVQRHEVLRTSFMTVEDQPVQVIDPTLTFTLPVVDLQQFAEVDQEAEVLRLTAEEAQRPFNLAKAPLLRATLLQLSEVEQVVLFTMHHIIFDDWSMMILIKEVVALYEAFNNCHPSLWHATLTPLLELPIQYADFAVWQQQWLQGEELQTQLSYWKQQLNGTPSIIELPTDRPRPVIQTYRGAKQSLVLPQSLTQKLKKLSQQEGVTLFMTLLAAFKVLLSHYTQQNDILVGTPTANRNRFEIEGLIGFFVNTLVLRTDLGGNPSFRELLRRVREVTLGAYAHQDLPFEYLVEKLQPERDLSYSPLFQVMFALQNVPKDEFQLSGITLSSLKLEKQTAQFDLSVDLFETESELRGWFEYNTDLFDTSTVTRMVNHFCNLLSGIVSNPEQRLWQLPMLTEIERHQLLVEWNDTQTDYPKNQCIHQLFEAQVERASCRGATLTPDAIAVVFVDARSAASRRVDQQLTYCELNRRANQLAHHLRSLGVGPEVLVGICVERSLSMVIGLLGILKAGGAYVPLDPSYPQERLAFILQDAQVSVLLTQQRLIEAMPQHKAKVICLDTDWQTIAQQSQENLFSEVATNNLAYVIYTSGSTGKPKGVQIPHSALSNFLQSMRQTPGLSEQGVLLAVTTYSFDIAALELFLPITVGARLVVLSREIASDGTRLEALLTDSNATVMQATPATWQLLLAAGWQGNHQLKILCGGEALPGQLANQLLKRCDSLWNMYGPTETTIWSAACQVEKDISIVPISQPIANTQFYILNQHAQLVPVGVPGELHIGGDGLARGYFNRPELTAEKFIPNSFSDKPAARLYKTGDLARYSPSGEIEYLGRIDHQVKVRGFRIELGEIEAHLSQHPAIQNTVVVVRDYQTDFQQIVAYIVPQKEQTLTVTELRDFLESKLPNYMVPRAFMMLEALPLTPNGKIDRTALPAPDLTQQLPQSNFVAPSTPIEEMLALIWVDILGVEKVGIHDNFFTLGGHSLLATRVISQVRQVFEVELPLRRLFEEPTIAGIAKDIEKATIAGLGLETQPIKRISRSQELPLSFAQQRLWFINQLQPGNSAYNISSAMRLFGWLNMAVLEQSFNEVVRRHEVLRTTFTTRDGQPIQVIVPTFTFRLPVVDLQELPIDLREAEVLRLAHEQAQQPFDLTNGPLLRVTLLQQTQTEHALLLTMHHIISDGWSIGVLIREITVLYETFSHEKPSPLAELPIQYADFAVWQRQWLQSEKLETQLAYWKQQLGGRLPVLELPTDRPRPTIQTFSGARESLVLPKTITEKLKALNQRQGITLFMILLAAFGTLLFWYTEQEDIIVGTDIANRNQAETKGLIGFFVNQLVLRTDLSGNPTFLELLERVRKMTLEAYTHQDLPFDKLVDALNPKRELNRSPLFQVKIVLNNTQIPSLELPGLTISPLKVENKTVQFDLLLELNETEQGLFGVWKYNTDLFDTVSIVRMSKNFKALLGKIATQPEAKLNELKTILSEADKQQNLAQEQTYDSAIQQKLMNVKRRTKSRL
ncbi:MAG: amino acid adenylation domain-containing protein [Iphinoe sp. HA4291-MV1]|jgi:amino acid adenylation domain-containing protein|nr:amino acid adenylation domain-containing protein [Iphinoe sp. HA4291-MV1]